MTSFSTTATPKRIALSGVIGVVILAGLWFAFRPEKLFINKKVNEAPPPQAGPQVNWTPQVDRPICGRSP